MCDTDTYTCQLAECQRWVETPDSSRFKYVQILAMTLELYPVPPLPHDPVIRWGGVEPCCFIMARTPSTTPCIMAGMSSPGSSTWFLGIPWLKRLKPRCHDKSSWKLHWFGSALPWLRPRCAQTSFTKRESHPCFTRRSERLERERERRERKKWSVQYGRAAAAWLTLICIPENLAGWICREKQPRTDHWSLFLWQKHRGYLGLLCYEVWFFDADCFL